MHPRGGATALIVFLVLAAAGCGGADKRTGGTPNSTDTSGKRGGDLTVLSISDVTSLDPGYWYYAYDYQALAQPTQRALYGWKPADTAPSPDLATGMPKTSGDGRTVTIKIRPDIRYSPPLRDRTVTSADVKYAIERTFLPSVRNLYAKTYFGAITGSDAFRAGQAAEISGIQTPDDTTLILRLKRPAGVISNGQALSLPGTVPVPEDVAAPHDARSPSTYGAHQVFTGPYMIEADAKGAITGYEAGRSLKLVRNPSWDAKTDHRPAYLDTMTFNAHNTIDGASRRILSDESLASGDFASPPVNVLRSALDTRSSQLAIVPSQTVRYVALNTQVKPFNRPDVRRAAAAAIDRNALRATRGGPPLGAIATHFLAPGLPGFQEAGAAKGTFEFMQKAGGDLDLARMLMRRAGFPSGRYSGPPLLMVGESRPPGSDTAKAVQRQLERLGFRFELRQATRTGSFNELCGVAAARVAVCANGEWAKDFFDAESVLDPVFNGERIVPAGSLNWSQVDDPELNAALEIAASETDPQTRAKAYAEIDRTVTGRAYVVPWLWDNQINSVSANVKGVVNRFNASWDMAYLSLK